jgi:hypothetical protein
MQLSGHCYHPEWWRSPNPQYKIENWVTFVVWHLRNQCQSPYPRKTNEDNKPSEQTRETKFKSCLSLCSFVTESMLNPILFICFLNGITSTLQTSKNIPELFDKLSLEPRNVFYFKYFKKLKKLSI